MDNRVATTARNGSHRRIDGPELPSKCRIALYSHDTMGIGHVRRNMLIAQTLARSPIEATILVITGAREASVFATPPSTDLLTLPSLCKQAGGGYRSRCLGIPLKELIHLRAEAIGAAIASFDPDVLIVDKVPRGAEGELDKVLESICENRQARCVLGLREVLDDSAAVEREWREMGNEQVIRDYFDAVWVYGDRTVYDPVSEYHLSPDIAAKTHYTGYLDQRAWLEFDSNNEAGPLDDLGLPPGRLVVCSVGGGQDGARLAETFARVDLPRDTNAVIMAGPFMPAEPRRRLASQIERQQRMRLIDFIAKPERLLGRADRVIAMGGYNTICEVLSFEKRALIVPRVAPRREQLVRAERLESMGILDMLHPSKLSSAALSEWLARDLGPDPSIRDRIDIGGLDRLPRLLSEVLNGSPSHTQCQSISDGVHHD